MELFSFENSLSPTCLSPGSLCHHSVNNLSAIEMQNMYLNTDISAFPSIPQLLYVSKHYYFFFFLALDFTMVKYFTILTQLNPIGKNSRTTA